jgi:hypothetical protein
MAHMIEALKKALEMASTLFAECRVILELSARSNHNHLVEATSPWAWAPALLVHPSEMVFELATRWRHICHPTLIQYPTIGTPTWSWWGLCTPTQAAQHWGPCALELLPAWFWSRLAFHSYTSRLPSTQEAYQWHNQSTIARRISGAWKLTGGSLDTELGNQPFDMAEGSCKVYLVFIKGENGQ